MLPNIIKEQSISAANGGHSPCDELSIGLVSSSSRSRLGQTIVLILPGGDSRARTRPGGCNMSDDSISECTSQLWSSPGRVLLMVLAATISARLLLAAGHPQYCLLCRGQHFGHRYSDEYTFYC